MESNSKGTTVILKTNTLTYEGLVVELALRFKECFDTGQQDTYIFNVGSRTKVYINININSLYVNAAGTILYYSGAFNVTAYRDGERIVFRPIRRSDYLLSRLQSIVPSYMK